MAEATTENLDEDAASSVYLEVDTGHQSVEALSPNASDDGQVPLLDDRLVIAVAAPFHINPCVVALHEENEIQVEQTSEDEAEAEYKSKCSSSSSLNSRSSASSSMSSGSESSSSSSMDALPFHRAPCGSIIPANVSSFCHTRGLKHSPVHIHSDKKANSGIFASIRRSGRRILNPVLAASGRKPTDPNNAYRDILSITIYCQMYHLTNRILSNLDAVSLETCEEVCLLWKSYISKEKIWKRVVETSAMMAPELMKQNGWSKHLAVLGGQNPMYDDVFRELYWKMTNLGLLWKYRDPLEKKNHIRRSGSISWCFLRSGRSVSVYTKGRGYVLKIHEDMTNRFRHAQTVTLGTVKKDTLCLDSSEKQIVVGGLVSQKVWVFNIKEGRQPNKGALETLIDLVKRQKWRNAERNTRIYTDIFKFINAGAGVSKVKLHTDGKRMAVLLPLNQTVEIWDIGDVVRLQSHAVPSDSSFLFWRNDLLVTAPIYSGIIQAIDTESETEVSSMAGNIRRIDALAVFGKLCATGEGSYIKLWNLNKSSHMMSWNATKTFISALFMNDAMVISGSSAGIVKLWELKAILKKDATTLQPLRRISMKGMMHYPIKMITQLSYVDLIIVAKYEAKRKKDKIKFVRVKTEDATFPKDCDT